MTLVKVSKLCFNCLQNSHMINSCKSKVFYRVDNCKKKHHALLHSINEGNNNNSSSNDITQNYQTNQHTNRYELNQKRVQLKCYPPFSSQMGVYIEAMVKFTKQLKEIFQITYLHWVGGVLTIIRNISGILFLPKVTRNETRSSASFRTLFQHKQFDAESFDSKMIKLSCFANLDTLNCDPLRDFVPFVQLKKREIHPWRSANFNKVAGFTLF